MIPALLRVTLAGAAGLALWRFAGVGRVYGFVVAWIAAQSLRVAGWSPHVSWTADGARLSLSRTDPHTGWVTGIVPLAWPYLLTLTSGTVVLLTLLGSGAVLVPGAPARVLPARAAIAGAALILSQALAIALLVGGSIPGGAPVLSQVGDLLSTGVGLVVPPLAWAWAVWGRPRP